MLVQGTCRANHRRGWYQSLDPDDRHDGQGTRVEPHTTKASRNTPTAKLKPIAWMIGSLVNMKATKMENMISAAAVTTRAEQLREALRPILRVFQIPSGSKE